MTKHPSSLGSVLPAAG